MRTLKFYGASDDLFEVEGTKAGEPDEIGSFNSITAVKIANDHAGLIVVGVYAAHDDMPKGMPGCWTIGICPLDEDIPLPDWQMKWSLSDLGYSPLLAIETPDDARVSQIGAPEEEE